VGTEARVFELPKVGESVGDYRIVSMLGSGAQGNVYKAECAGRFFVLKFIQHPSLDVWGEREIAILQRLKHRHVVRFLGCGRWPDPEHGSLFIAMEFVDGPTLRQYVLERNPTAREAAAIGLIVVQTLAELLARGVAHRDIKNTNILMRRGTGEPVLVDFGLGDQVGLSSVPGVILFGTPDYISPEAWLHARNPGRLGRLYKPGDKEEQWALGVLLYWLFTDEMPFGSYKDEEDVQAAVLSSTPRAPHVVNPRVPPAMSRVITRLLEKKPANRFKDMGGAATALETALAVADESWEVPLCEPEDDASTIALAGLPEPDESMRRCQELRKVWRRPARGRRPVRPPPPVPDDVAAGTAPSSNPTVVLLAPLDAPPVAHEPVAICAPAPTQHKRIPDWFPSLVGFLPVRAVALAAVRHQVSRLALVGLLVVCSVAMSGHGPHRVLNSTQVPSAVLRVEEPRPSAIQQTSSVQEVAPEPESLESGQGAVPFEALTPASMVPAAMLRKDETPLKTDQKPALPPQRKALRALASKCVGAACCSVLAGCAGSAPQVRATPQSERCPPGAVETMKQLKLYVGAKAYAVEPRTERMGPTIVRESTTFQLIENMGELKAGTVLSGRLIFGKSRVYGRFTEATLPRRLGGKTYPVCIVLYTLPNQEKRGGGFYEPGLGTDYEDPESFGLPPVSTTGDSALIFSTQVVMVVDHFE
jgi:serine/threonine-protein kinase